MRAGTKSFTPICLESMTAIEPRKHKSHILNDLIPQNFCPEFKILKKSDSECKLTFEIFVFEDQVKLKAIPPKHSIREDVEMKDETDPVIDFHGATNGYLAQNMSPTGIPNFSTAEKACLDAVRQSFAEIRQQLENFAVFLSLAEIIDFYKLNGYGNHAEIKSRKWMTAIQALNIAGSDGYHELRAIVDVDETEIFISPRNLSGEQTVPFFFIAYTLDKLGMSGLDPNVFYDELSKFNRDPVECIQKMLQDKSTS